MTIGYVIFIDTSRQIVAAVQVIIEQQLGNAAITVVLTHFHNALLNFLFSSPGLHHVAIWQEFS